MESCFSTGIFFLELVAVLGVAVSLVMFVATLLSGCQGRDEVKGLLVTVAVAVFCSLVIIKVEDTDPACVQRNQTRQLEQDRKDAIPRLVSEGPEGCKVYGFKQQGLWHYYTRCPSSVTYTDTQHTERIGKRTVTKSSRITTQPGDPE